MRSVCVGTRPTRRDKAGRRALRGAGGVCRPRLFRRVVSRVVLTRQCEPPSRPATCAAGLPSSSAFEPGEDSGVEFHRLAVEGERVGELAGAFGAGFGVGQAALRLGEVLAGCAEGVCVGHVII